MTAKTFFVKVWHLLTATSMVYIGYSAVKDLAPMDWLLSIAVGLAFVLPFINNMEKFLDFNSPNNNERK